MAKRHDLHDQVGRFPLSSTDSKGQSRLHLSDEGAELLGE